MARRKHLSETQVSSMAFFLSCMASGASVFRLMQSGSTEQARHVRGCDTCAKRVLLCVCLSEAISELPTEEMSGCTDEEIMNALIEGAAAKYAGIIAGA